MSKKSLSKLIGSNKNFAIKVMTINLFLTISAIIFFLIYNNYFSSTQIKREYNIKLLKTNNLILYEFYNKSFPMLLEKSLIDLKKLVNSSFNFHKIVFEANGNVRINYKYIIDNNNKEFFQKSKIQNDEEILEVVKIYDQILDNYYKLYYKENKKILEKFNENSFLKDKLINEDIVKFMIIYENKMKFVEIINLLINETKEKRNINLSDLIFFLIVLNLICVFIVIYRILNTEQLTVKKK